MGEGALLLELQEIDVEIIRSHKRLEELPEKRALLELRHKQREIAAMREKALTVVRALETQVKARQDEVDSVNDKIATEQVKALETTDHRAVQSITREMDALRRRIDKLEVEEIGLLERIEKARVQLQTIEQALESYAKKDAALVVRYKEAGGALQSEITALEDRRSRVAGGVSPDVLARYDGLRASKGGVGVGILQGETCSACRMTLPAERVRDLRAGGQVGRCPSCQRLIVVGEPL